MATVHPLGAAETPSSSALVEKWGNLINADSNCKVAVAEDQITMQVPGGIFDFSGMHGRKNAPRILQEVTGDFTVTVRVSGAFSPGKPSPGSNSLPFVSAGLMVWESDSNYLRLERNVWQDREGERWSYAPLFEYWKNGRNLRPANGTLVPYFKGTNTWLRLSRTAEQITAEVSHDGKEWIKGGSVRSQFGNKVQVGMMAINTSGTSHEVCFSEYVLTPQTAAPAGRKEP